MTAGQLAELIKGIIEKNGADTKVFVNTPDGRNWIPDMVRAFQSERASSPSLVIFTEEPRKRGGKKDG